MTTQCFLDNEERSLFAENSQEYLIREVHEYDFEKINKSNKIKLESYGLFQIGCGTFSEMMYLKEINGLIIQIGHMKIKYP